MKLKLIACKALARELSYVCALSDNSIDVTWIRQGYHGTPEKLNTLLQEEIDRIESGFDDHTNAVAEGKDFDAIVLGYGLCSKATLGLKTKSHRLVIPRAHDCITLLLGSKERYDQYFHEMPGTYWYSASWIENTDMPCEASMLHMKKFYESQGYDEDTIDFLMEEVVTPVGYKTAAYINMPVKEREEDHEFTKTAAEYFGWNYCEIDGSLSLLEQMVAGNWNPEAFLVLEPGETAKQNYGKEILEKVPADL